MSNESVYYNDSEPFVCDWLENLIREKLLPAGVVDRRPIQEVEPKDVQDFTQCHFFAGIGGWAYALQLARWGDRPVWTGSCPCQPFSSAARARFSAVDHWPSWCALITLARPRTVFGEQVANARHWFDRVCDDLDALDYEVGASILPAVSVGADHLRQRLFFAAHAVRGRQSGRALYAEASRLPRRGDHTGTLLCPHGISGRVGRLRAYGNAIVPQVAAAFVGAYMEVAGL